MSAISRIFRSKKHACRFFLPALAVGAPGGVGSTYGFVPKLYTALRAAWNAGELDEARRLQLRCRQFVKIFLKHGHSRQAQKAILKMIGFDFGPSRLPIPPLRENAEQLLHDELVRDGFIAAG